MFRSYREVACVPHKSNKRKIEYSSQYSTCNICYAGYLSETEVEVHRRKVHKRELEKLYNNKKKFLCFTCLKEFPSKQEVIEHTKSVHLLSSEGAFRIEREIFICDICNSIFFNKDMLAVHLMHTHYVRAEEKGKTWGTCPVCFRSIRLRKTWCHFEKHQMQSVSCCKMCFAKCRNSKSLQEHLKSHQLHLYCNICGYEANKCHIFKNHITEQHKYKIDVWPVVDFKRYFVNKIFDRYTGIRWKLENQCSWRGVKNLNGLSICVLCREICEDDSSMNLHIVRDHMTQIQAQEVKCRHMCWCGKEFFSIILLKHHIFKTKGAHRILEQHEIPATSKTQDIIKTECAEPSKTRDIIKTDCGETSETQDIIKTECADTSNTQDIIKIECVETSETQDTIKMECAETSETQNIIKTECTETSKIQDIIKIECVETSETQDIIKMECAETSKTQDIIKTKCPATSTTQDIIKIECAEMSKTQDIVKTECTGTFKTQNLIKRFYLQ